MPIFRVKSVKIYTGQFFFYTDMSVVSVTNMRYDSEVVLDFRFGTRSARTESKEKVILTY